LFKYYESYCEIKSKASTDPKLIHCGPFGEYDFVIDTNVRMESKSPLQGADSEPISILSYRNNCGKYITWDNNYDSEFFSFLRNLQNVHYIEHYLKICARH
jgi:hypothetical protein